MIKFYILLSFSLLLGLNVRSQEMWNKMPLLADPIVCYASEAVNKIFIPPPAAFTHRLKSGSTETQFVISYVNFPDSIKPAFEYAVSIWASLIASSVPIHIQAQWLTLQSTTLGSCSPGNFYQNFPNAPLRNTYYPVALAEKLQEAEISGPGSPDMTARFNSTIPWYFGTDGQTPTDKYDFVSTVLHEIAHGLGFTGLFTADIQSKLGRTVTSNKNASIFDSFIQDFQQNHLINTSVYANPSGVLYDALISNQLYHASPLAMKNHSDQRPRLYAPTTWNSGSSIYHLNDFSFPFGNANSLMTHASGKGEAIHNPGPITTGILMDLGWKHLYFRHEPLVDTEDVTGPFSFSLAIDSDSGLDSTSVYLVYSFSEFDEKSDSVSMQYHPADGKFRTSVPPVGAQGTLLYYFAAEDTLDRRFTGPAQAPESYHYFNYGPDMLLPEIAHEPVSFLLTTEKQLTINARVTDNIGINKVYVVFGRKGAAPDTLLLTHTGNSYFETVYTIPSSAVADGGIISYAIFAEDASANRNLARLPQEGTFDVVIESIFEAVASYKTDFTNAKSHFILGDFDIKKADNFDSEALHSPNPYPSPEVNDGFFNFITTLRYPIVVKDGGIVSFEEVVLVEPGEPGTKFGDDEFWDYVIVEASSDFGNSWLPLADGYDSGNRQVWLNAYNSLIVGNNSRTNGTKDLFVSREIVITENGNFSAGDTLLVRFRLFSDPFANGWGWAIDNLSIQYEPPTNAIIPAQTEMGIKIYPNPFREYLTLSFSGIASPAKDIKLLLYDLTGRLVHVAPIENMLPGTEVTLHLPGIPKGIFVASLMADELVLLRSKVVRH